MKQEEFENIIKDKVSNEQLPLDLDKMWLRVEPKLQKQKRSRFILFWFLGVGAFALVLSQLTTKKMTESITDEQSSLTKSVVIQPSMLTLENEGIVNLNESNETETIAVDDENDPKIDRFLPDSNKPEEKKDPIAFEFENRTRIIGQSSPVEVESAIFDESQQEEGFNGGVIFSESIEMSIQPIPYLRNLPVGDLVLPSFEMASVIEKDFKTKPKSRLWQIEAAIGYYVVDRKLKSLDSFLDREITLRNQQEEVLDAQSFELNIGRQLFNRFGAKIGIIAIQSWIKNRVDHMGFQNNIEIQNFLVSKEVSESGVVENRQDIVVENHIHTQGTQYNVYRSFGLNGELFYSYPIQRFHIVGSVDLHCMLATNNHGRIVYNGALYSLDMDKEDIMNSSIQYNWSVGLGTQYQINEKSFLEVELKGIFPFQNLHNQTTKLFDKHNLLGANISYGYKF